MVMTRCWISIAFVGAAAAPTLGQLPVPLHDDFDVYRPGDPISTLSGWELWPGGLEAVIADERAFSGPNSLHLHQQGADVVHRLTGYESVDARFSMMLYISSASRDLEGYVIALSQYDGGGPGTEWTIQVKVDATAGELEAQFYGIRTPLIFDRWVEWRADISLDCDEYHLYYDGRHWAGPLSWSGCVTCGLPILAAIDFYVHGLGAGPGMYIDDVVVRPVGLCYADCDDSGELDFFDFLCFQNLFAASDARADCDRDGALTFFDFLCFQNEFAAGCG